MEMDFLNPGVSDHRPGSLCIKKSFDIGQNHLNFMDSWIKQKEFNGILQGSDMYENPMRCLCLKLKGIEGAK